MALTEDSYGISVQIATQFEQLCNASLLRRVAAQTLRHQMVESGSLTIRLTDDEEIRELNRNYRGIDDATDVLSFPNCAEMAPTDIQLIVPDELAEVETDYLGDLLIAVPYTSRQAEKLNRSLEDELNLLVAHGVLHLLGYDHATDEDEAQMWSIQNDILQEIGRCVPHVDSDARRVPAALTGRDRGFWRGRWYSFQMALNGAIYTLRTQPNAWIEMVAVSIIVLAGLFFRITPVEWGVLSLAVFLVITLEAVNTAVEATVDLVTTEFHPLAKIAKDSAAGALVFGVVCSLCVAAAIFGPRVWRLLAAY